MSIKINLGTMSALTLLFVVLKLTGVVAWSWWIVFEPILIELAFILLLFIGIGLFATLAKLTESKEK